MNVSPVSGPPAVGLLEVPAAVSHSCHKVKPSEVKSRRTVELTEAAEQQVTDRGRALMWRYSK